MVANKGFFFTSKNPFMWVKSGKMWRVIFVFWPALLSSIQRKKKAVSLNRGEYEELGLYFFIVSGDEKLLK